MSQIFTIGDSHSRFGFQDIVGVSYIHIGPRLMFSVGRDGLDIAQYNIKEGNIVIFCFGEIDCRCHINKYDCDYKENIELIVENYFTMINQNVEKYKITAVVFNVVPPVEAIHKSHLMGEYPLQGSDNQRKSYTLYINECLKKQCTKFGYLYFDVYDKYCCENDFLKESLSDGIVHINDSLYLKEFIDKNLR